MRPSTQSASYCVRCAAWRAIAALCARDHTDARTLKRFSLRSRHSASHAPYCLQGGMV